MDVAEPSRSGGHEQALGRVVEAFDSLVSSLRELAEEMGPDVRASEDEITSRLAGSSLTGARVASCMSALLRLTPQYSQQRPMASPYACSFCLQHFHPRRIVMSGDSGVCQNCALDFTAGLYSRDQVHLAAATCSFCQAAGDVFITTGAPAAGICMDCVMLSLEIIYDPTTK